MIIKRPFWYPPGNSDRTLHIYLPDDYYSTEERYPVIYFFDGHNLFFNEDATFGKSWGLKEFLDYWHKKMIIVGIECSHEGNQRLQEYCPYVYTGKFWGVLHGTGKETLLWMTEELKPDIDREFRTYAFREATGIAGMIVTSKVSGYEGNTIFLPAAGSWKYSTLQDEETLGYYMSSSLDLDNPFNSTANYFNYASVLAPSLYRYIGVPVRAVYGAYKPEYYHAYVDLGLPSELKWATCNIGADKPEDYGDYFAWGETEPKTNCSWSTYKWCNGSDDTQTKYNTNSSYGTVDNKTVLDLEDDAVHVNWGGRWRMPTDAEWTELINKCTWTWTSQNGVNGRLVTGPNGKSIFLPAAGFRYSTDLDNAGSYGIYWSSSLKSDYPYDAYGVYFYSDGVERGYGGRCYGRSVRPVSE